MTSTTFERQVFRSRLVGRQLTVFREWFRQHKVFRIDTPLNRLPEGQLLQGRLRIKSGDRSHTVYWIDITKYPELRKAINALKVISSRVRGVNTLRR